MSVDAVIQTHNLSKNYHHPFFYWVVRARALQDLTLSVGRGEVFGLLGPNGSGKSTSIKLILGLLFPTAGQVAVYGKRPDDVSIKARIGFLPEESYLYRFLDAEETLDFYGRLFKLSRRDRLHRIDSLLELVGLTRERKRPIAEFSKGMQRRIGLAQCLINDPDLVILDEPTTGLDPLGTREIKDLIIQLREKGKTVLLSSHLLADVEDVCDRVCILYGGRIQAMGAVDSLLQQDRMVQITAEMDDATVEEIRALIRKRQGDSVEVQVSPPQERLEQFFLRTVQDAQEQRLETSGVDASRGQLDFLSTREDATEGLLNKLTQEDTAADDARAKAAAAVHVIEEEAPAAELLSSLATEATEEKAAEAPVTPEKEPPQGDQNLLDQLTKGDG